MKRGFVGLLLLLACGPGAPDRKILSGQQDLRGSSFVQPAGTIAVNFSVDDRANRVYGAGDLKWKGSFVFDETTRTLTFDPYWSAGLAGWPTLYDDGPWTEGGHEPIGARAHDAIWGVTAFVTPPAEGTDIYEYGLTDALYENTLGNGWIWKGPNGMFAVDAGTTEAVTATGMTLPKFGPMDLQLLLDTTKLAQFPDWTWDTSVVTVKSSAWGWGEIAMRDAGGGLRAFELWGYVGRQRLLAHSGLLNCGDVPEFVFVIGGFEYLTAVFDGTNWSIQALTDGVAAGVRLRHAGAYVPAPIEIVANGNTAITVPSVPACIGDDDED